MVVNAGKVGQVISITGSKLTGVLSCEGAAARSTEDVGPQFGRLVKIPTETSTVFGIVCSLWVTESNEDLASARRMVAIELLGEVRDDGNGEPSRFRRGISTYPPLGSEIFLVTGADLACVYAPSGAASVRVGIVQQDQSLPAFIAADRLLGKHFAVLGTTGSGKSCAVALILRSILNRYPNGHLIILDPHNEYSAAFGDCAELLTTNNLHLPFWLMNAEELVATLVSTRGADRDAEVAILKGAVLEARRRFAGDDADFESITVDTPVPFRMGDVQRSLSASMGRLTKAESSLPYLRLQARIDALSADSRFAFLFEGLVVKDSMADILAQILRIPVAGRPATLIDLSGVPSEIMDVVVSLLCRLVFDFAVWSADSGSVPVLLVCEEAHRYVANEDRRNAALSREILARIAKEGRKYGVSLCLVSQRPSELSPTILSQCNTVFALRMANEHDQDFIRKILPEGSTGMLAALPSLHTGEAIVVGEGVSAPMRLCFDDLAFNHRPRSATAEFSHAWSQDSADRSLLEDTIDRWRRQVRSDDLFDA